MERSLVSWRWMPILPCSEYGVLILGARNWRLAAETLAPAG